VAPQQFAKIKRLSPGIDLAYSEKLRGSTNWEGRMADRIIERHIHHTDGSSDGGSGAMTALAVMLMVLLLVAVLYFTGAFGRMFGSRQTSIDINIKKPNIILPIR
jgi:hypothetical protein